MRPRQPRCDGIAEPIAAPDRGPRSSLPSWQSLRPPATELVVRRQRRSEMKDAGASRGCGLLGLVAALGMGASDLLMLARPVSVQEFVRLGLGNLALIPEGRLTVAAVLGVVFSALYVPGFWSVAQATGPAGQRPAFVVL